MFRRIVFLSIGLLLLSSLTSGCIFPIHSPVALVESGTRPAYKLALAVESNGQEHIFWSMGPTSEHIFGSTDAPAEMLYYWRANLGIRDFGIFHVWTTNIVYEGPDVAVTDDGNAYLTWTAYHTSAGYRVHTYDILPHADSYPYILGNALDYDGIHLYYGHKPPLVVARGNVAYAVFDRYIEEENRMILRYKQLAGGTDEGLVSPAADGNSHSYPHAAIDSNGKLHVVWVAIPTSGPDNPIVMYNSNATTLPSGDMNQLWTVFSNPAIAPGFGVDIAITKSGSNEMVHAVYGLIGTGPTNDSLHEQSCNVNGCTGKTFETVNLNPTLIPWRLGELKAAGAGSNLYIALLAQNAGTTVKEVYLYTGTGGTTPNRITTSSYPKITLKMAVVWEDSIGMPVIAWRQWDPVGSCEENIYIWSLNESLASEIRLIETQCDDPEDGEDLAANGQRVAGAWVSPLSAEDDRKVPWIAMNSYQLYLPVLSR